MNACVGCTKVLVNDFLSFSLLVWLTLGVNKMKRDLYEEVTMELLELERKFFLVGEGASFVVYHHVLTFEWLLF